LLLKHVTIRAFYNGWRFRKHMQQVENSISQLARAVLSLKLDDMGTIDHSSFSDKKRDIVPQTDLQAWCDREAYICRAPLLATELKSRVAHITDASHVLTQAIARASERELKWRDTATTFFARNTVLKEQVLTADQTRDDATAALAARSDELARMMVSASFVLVASFTNVSQ
jgi:hypothetical protein